MSEETEKEEMTTETAASAEVQTEETGGLTDNLREETPQPSDGNAAIPEGLDAEIFDPETRTLKEAAVVDRLKDLNKQLESAKKQANDMRRKLSKGVSAPDKKEEYAENWQPDERYGFLKDDDSDNAKHVRSVVDTLDDFAYQHGLSVETAKDLKDLYLQYAEDVKIIDARDDEQKSADRAAFIAEQKKLLGDNAEAIIRDNYKFFKNYEVFDDEEKKALLAAMDKSAAWNSIGYKIRKLFGQTGSADIPVRGSLIQGLADDRTLAREYYAEDTTMQRRMEILQQRIDAGRQGSLPAPEA